MQYDSQQDTIIDNIIAYTPIGHIATHARCFNVLLYKSCNAKPTKGSYNYANLNDTPHSELSPSILLTTFVHKPSLHFAHLRFLKRLVLLLLDARCCAPVPAI